MGKKGGLRDSGSIDGPEMFLLFGQTTLLSCSHWKYGFGRISPREKETRALHALITQDLDNSTSQRVAKPRRRLFPFPQPCTPAEHVLNRVAASVICVIKSHPKAAPGSVWPVSKYCLCCRRSVREFSGISEKLGSYQEP